MSTVASRQRVVELSIQRIGQRNEVPRLTAIRRPCATVLDPETLAPGVGSLEAETALWTHRHLSLHRIVIAVAEIRVVGNRTELRICDDEVFRICVASQNTPGLANDAGVCTAGAR